MWWLIMFIYYYFFASPVIEAEKAPKQVKFEMLYTLDLTSEDIVETEANIAAGLVEEETPEGRVIMKYDDNGKCFHYWADKAKTYKYLETLARKYCILYDCRDNYINMFKELAKAKSERENPTSAKPAATDDVFVKFKSYEKKASVPDNKIVNERANVYKWKATIQEFRAVKEPVKPLKYSDFKKQIS